MTDTKLNETAIIVDSVGRPYQKWVQLDHLAQASTYFNKGFKGASKFDEYL